MAGMLPTGNAFHAFPLLWGCCQLSTLRFTLLVVVTVCVCMCVHMNLYSHGSQRTNPWRLFLKHHLLAFCFLFFADRICHWPGHFLHLLGWLAASQVPQASWSLPPQGCSIKEPSCYKFVKLFCAALHWFPFLLSILWAHTCFSVSQCLFAWLSLLEITPGRVHVQDLCLSAMPS